ncbi:MAG: hypothetical protein HW402_1201 [Dehalococcoidales bacterium]|nr:hypothetical protein [Dehalococcoidales bacterium]
MVWTELTGYLSKPELIIGQLKAQQEDANQIGVFEVELEDVKRQLKATDREQHQLLQWALKGFPEDQVETENRRLNKAKETLKAQQAELERQIKASKEAVVDVDKLDAFIQTLHKGIANLDYEGKRLALEMLGITVWLDGVSVEITGKVDVDESSIEPMPLRGGYAPSLKSFPRMRGKLRGV